MGWGGALTGSSEARYSCPVWLAEVEIHRPEKVRSEAAKEHHYKYREALPQRIGAGLLREEFDRVAGGQAIGETSAHDAREQSDQKAFFQIEFLDGRLLLRNRHGTLFVDARQTRDGNADETNGNAE